MRKISVGDVLHIAVEVTQIRQDRPITRYACTLPKMSDENVRANVHVEERDVIKVIPKPLQPYDTVATKEVLEDRALGLAYKHNAYFGTLIFIKEEGPCAQSIAWVRYYNSDSKYVRDEFVPLDKLIRCEK